MSPHENLQRTGEVGRGEKAKLKDMKATEKNETESEEITLRGDYHFFSQRNSHEDVSVEEMIEITYSLYAVAAKSIKKNSTQE